MEPFLQLQRTKLFSIYFYFQSVNKDDNKGLERTRAIYSLNWPGFYRFGFSRKDNSLFIAVKLKGRFYVS